MQVSNPNNIKIYNLSCGKSLPQFISDHKKRDLQKKDVNLRRRIELIQDFEMPTVSTKVGMTDDGNYIFAAGTYKPRIRCYDVHDLSLKFERCLDAEVVTFHTLSEDYSKIVMLLNDRYVEFHSQEGRWYRVRMPKFGRDMSYHSASCDLYLVGAGSEIYRLNLDHGRFYESFKTKASELNVCELNSAHHLLAVGTMEGKVECFDPRSRQSVGILDCAVAVAEENQSIEKCPQITALRYKDPLHMAVGTSQGQILLYDIRTNSPYVVKDHYYDLPIHSIDFNKENEVVLSSDQRCVKVWDDKTGKAVTAIETKHDINDVHLVRNSGLMFLANESPKIQTYFVPMLGPAPKWASFLDNLTEELEENPTQELYDDYKFVTMKELEELGLTHLIGSSLLKAYMHGYFMDMRLYNKAKSIANPFAYEEYRKKKIREKIEESRANRVQIKKLPKVNKGFAQRLISQAEEEKLNSGKKKKQKKEASSLLSDSRFKAMFENPDFEINEESDEFQLIKPVLSKQHEKEKRKLHAVNQLANEDKREYRGPDDSSDEEMEKKYKEEMKLAHRKIYNKGRIAMQNRLDTDESTILQPTLYQLKSNNQFSTIGDIGKISRKRLKEERKKLRTTFEERIQLEEDNIPSGSRKAVGAKQMTFRLQTNSKESKQKEEQKKHREERLKVRRSAKHLQRTKAKQNFFNK